MLPIIPLLFAYANLQFFQDKYYLVDSGYPNRIDTPFKGSTYHLPEFRNRRGRPPQGKYEIFNLLHSSLRNVIERAFRILKQKWRILKAMPSFSPRQQKHIIMACIALHNFIRDSKLRDEGLIDLMQMRSICIKQHVQRHKHKGMTNQRGRTRLP